MTASCSRFPGRGVADDRRQGQSDKRKKIGALAGDLAGVEEMFALKSLMEALGSPTSIAGTGLTALDPAWPGELSLQFHH
jgi:NADH dehydrogenase/NADH:ubiquinone oxidoreductase subunit G